MTGSAQGNIPTMKPPFGANQNSFGFTAPNSILFGQTGQMFGNTSGFGSPGQTFGQTAAPPMFGGTQQQTAPLFGQPSTAPSFGQPQQQTQQPAFGSSLFGASSQPQASTSLFGSPVNTSFGQQAKPSGYNFPATQPVGLFGQQPQQPTQQSSMFQPPASSNIFSSSGFGQSQIQAAQSGTVIKFTPVTGTDSMQKSGNSTMISTKHHCITCMKEYEIKSLEELRYEDYAANRKGPQQQSGFGAPTQPFGAVSSAPSSLFGTDNKTGFGASTSFGSAQTPSFGMTNQGNTGLGVFGKPATSGFGATTTTANTFGFTNTTPSSSLFGNTSLVKPFGATTSQPLFGQTQTQPISGFGNTGFFGQQPAQPQQTEFFNKPAQQSAFPTGTSSFSFGQTPASTQAANMFQATKPTTGFSLFPQNTGTTGFGQPAQTTSGFNTFNKPTQNIFGQPTGQQSAFGTNLGMQPTNSLFGNQQPKTSLFGGTTSGLFGAPNQGQSSFSMQPNQQQMQPLPPYTTSPEIRQMIHLSEPYGFCPHLGTLLPINPDRPREQYATNPTAIAETLKKDLRNGKGKKPMISSPAVVPKRLKLTNNFLRNDLFDSSPLDPDFEKLNLSFKRNARRLVISGTVLDTAPRPDIEGFPDRSHVDLNDPPVRSIGHKHVRITEDDISTSYFPRAANVIEARPRRNTSTQADLDTSPSEQDIDNINRLRMQKLEELSNRNNNSSIDTSGIICTRAEYYTVPALDKIAEYKNEDGTCLIKGFTIGRIGYGNVFFPDVIDVSNLNIDEILHFRTRELTIYTDDAKKPPRGEGLNRRAQITLENVYPKKAGEPKELETDPQALINMNYAESLRVVCIKHDTTFVDYRPETGSWTFKVKHFSKYGLSDSDDDTTIEVMAKCKARKELMRKEEVERSIREKEEKEAEEVRQRGLGGINSTHEFEVKSPTSVYYNIPEPEDEIMSMEIASEHNALPYQNMPKKKTEDTSPSNQDVKTYQNLFEKKMASAKGIAVERATVYEILNVAKHLPLCRSLVPARCTMDIAMLKGRSFKAGWGRGFTMVTVTSLPQESEEHMACNLVDREVFFSRNVSLLSFADVTPIVLGNLEPIEDPFDNLGDHIQIILEHCSVEFQNDEQGLYKIPYFKLNSGLDILVDECELFNENPEVYNRSPLTQYYRDIWNLCLALWANLDDEADSNLARRELFGKWLAGVTQNAVEEHISYEMNDFSKVLVLLSGHKINEAAKLAIELKAPQLALLLSLKNWTGITKQCIELQLTLWRSNGSLQSISTELQKIYLLMSGNIVLDKVNVCENLDWKRCLGLYLWYICPTCRPLTHAIQMYQQAFEAQEELCTPPSSFSEVEGKLDIMYLIMQLFCNNQASLEPILAPATHTIQPTDYRLSWLLLQSFKAMGVGSISQKAEYHISITFAHHLEHLGLYKWAIFVILCFPDMNLKKTLVHQILDRNITIDEEYDDEDDSSFEEDLIENEVVTDLRIPMQWLHVVKANKCKQLMKYWQAYKHLSFASLWNECHEVVLAHIVPTLVAEQNYVLLADILEDVAQGSSQVYKWKNKGGLLTDFIKLYFLLYQKPQVINMQNVHAIYNEIVLFVRRISGYPTATKEEVMTVSEISKLVSIFIRMLLNFAESRYDTYSLTLSALLKKMIMPIDYKYEEISKTIKIFEMRGLYL